MLHYHHRACITITAVKSNQIQTINVRGNITFPPEANSTLSADSHLYVELDETSLLDAPSVRIASQELDLDQFVPGEMMQYEFNVPAEDMKGPEVIGVGEKFVPICSVFQWLSMSCLSRISLSQLFPL